MPTSILSNTFFAAGGRILNVALGFVVVALITRYLGPTTYGHYVLLLAFGAIIQLVADGGLYLTLTRDYGQQQGDQQFSLLSNIISLRFILLVTLFTIGAIVTLFIPAFQGLFVGYFIIAIGLVFQSLSQLLLGIYQHYQRIWLTSVSDIVGRLVQLACILMIGVVGITITTTAVAFTLGTAVTFVLYQALLPRTVTWRPIYDGARWRQLLAVSWPLGAMLLLNAVYFRIDSVVLAVFRSPAEVGWYGLAYRIIESSLFFPAMLGALLLPRFSEALSAKQLIRAGKYLAEGLQIIVPLATLAVVLLLMTSRELVVFISGPDYLPAAKPLVILSVALATMFVGNLFGFMLVALKRQKTLLYLYLVLALCNTGLNVLLIPAWGMTAAAVTTVVTELAAASIAGYIVWRILRFRISVLWLSGILLSAGGTIAVMSLTSFLPLLAQLLVGVVSFTGFGVVLGVVTSKQLTLLRAT